MGSSIISYKFDQPGIGYKVGDKLTPIGIPTTSPLTRFVLTVEEVQGLIVSPDFILVNL